MNRRLGGPKIQAWGEVGKQKQSAYVIFTFVELLWIRTPPLKFDLYCNFLSAHWKLELGKDTEEQWTTNKGVTTSQILKIIFGRIGTPAYNIKPGVGCLIEWM